MNKRIVKILDLFSGTCSVRKALDTMDIEYSHKTNKKLYYIWVNMKQRCYNINSSTYKWYGAKGVEVCDEWLNDFQTFAKWSFENGYIEGLSIDRKTEDGYYNYSPKGCQWITRSENSRKSQTGRKKPYLSIRNKECSKVIVVWDNKGFKQEYKSLKNACINLNLDNSALSRVARGQQVKHKGFYAKYSEVNGVG
jgi:hypothetical protein